MKKSLLLFAFIFACNFVLAQDYFIKFDGIDGESTNHTHRGWSDIESFHQEINGEPISSGNSRVRRNFTKNISFVKIIDKSSPRIMDLLIKGKIIPKVLLEVTKSGNVFYRYELKNVAVINYAISGKDKNPPIEEVTISFEQQNVKYTEYLQNGKSKGVVETNFN